MSDAIGTENANTPEVSTDDAAAMMEEVSRRGEAIYRERLQGTLEPEHNGEYVAIHVDTGDYALASRYGEAIRQMQERHPQSLLAIRHVGPVTADSPLARLLSRDALPSAK